jgi:hypothetical protein
MARIIGVPSAAVTLIDTNRVVGWAEAELTSA